MISNWKTSLVGLALIAMGIIGMSLVVVDKATGVGMITVGLGFLVAKDHNVTGGTAQQ